MKKRTGGWILAITCCVALAGPFGIAQTAEATTFLNETFTYPDGNLVGNGAWTAHSGAGNGPIQVVSGAALVVHPTGSEDANVNFGVVEGPGQTFYAGFDLINTGGSGDLYFAHFKPSINFNFRGRVFITSHAGGDFTVAVGNESNIALAAVSPNPMTFGVTYRVVVSYAYDTGDCNLFVDGIQVAHFDGVTGGGAGMDHDLEPMDTFALRQTTGTSTQTIDNLIVADTLNEAHGGPAVTLGSCCDAAANICDDDISLAFCAAPAVWNPGGSCAVDCILVGSCCDETFVLPCVDGVIEADCPPPLVWTGQSTCAVECVAGACCDGAGVCTPGLTKQNCLAQGGIYLGPGTDCTGGCPDFAQVKINEIRISEPGPENDEYFELVGPPGFPLGGLSYIVIGDGPGGSGVLDEVIDLTGQVIPADGHFLAADSTVFTLGPIADIDLDTPLNFEDSDNVTHMLVAGFVGFTDDDLDTNDDCTLDLTPWVIEADRVALLEEPNPPVNTECHYGTTPDNTIGPSGIFVPGHIFRLPDASLPWVIGQFEPPLGSDTPGAVNALGTGACCSIDPNGGAHDLICTITDKDNCENVLLGVYKGTNVTCAEVGDCRGACCVFGPMGTTCTPNVFPGECDQVLGGIYAGDAVPCVPDPCAALCSDLATAHADHVAGGGVDLSVRLCSGGMVVSNATNINNSAFPSFHLADSSGADGQTGLTVFSFDAVAINNMLTQIGGGDPAMAEGTEVQMQGTLNGFNGLLELVDGSPTLLPLEVLGSGTPGAAGVPPPLLVTLSDFQGTAGEAFESELTRLECFAFLDDPTRVPPLVIDGTSTFVGGGADGSYSITDGTLTGIFRVGNADLDIAGTVIPTGMVSASGVFNQFFDYQILPRRLAEIEVDPPNCGPTGACTFTAQPGLCRELTAEICAFVGGTFDPSGVCLVACGSCEGDMNGDTLVTDLDTPLFVSTLLAGGPSLCADLDGNGSIDGGDIQMYVDRVVAGFDCLAGPPARNLVECIAGQTPPQCDGDTAGWCVYQVTNVNVFGPPCNSLFVTAVLSVPCDAMGSCDPIGTPPEVFRWINGNPPDDCFFEAERAIFAGCDLNGFAPHFDEVP